MGSGSSVENKAEFKTKFLADLKEIKESHPGNLCAKHLTEEYLNSLSEEDQEGLIRCCITGIKNKDSALGCYAMKPTDYATFKPFFDPVIREYHKDESGEKKHETCWETGDADLDVTKLGLPELSMRVRVGRNLKTFPLPGAMTKEDRINFEKTMLKAFDALIANPDFGGKVHSLTPDFGEGEANPNLISNDEYEQLVKDHIMFKDMSADTYLETAGIASDWPYGRGCYVSEDKQSIIWFGEEDQLRIMCMKTGTKLNEVFDRLNNLLKTVEAIDGIDFAADENYGYITSCPSNLGTGMRASVHIKVPKLTAGGSDTKAKEVCKPLGLSVRGTGGEHTPIGEDGTIDLSPSARLFIKESTIISSLYEGISKLMELENAEA